MKLITQDKHNVCMYNPKPLDTSSIMLPDDLEGLIEMMAENNHDLWAQSRIEEGWIYGSARDDNLKKHPCLVPYAELPESEKEYDRKMAREGLKIILSLGYKIAK